MTRNQEDFVRSLSHFREGVSEKAILSYRRLALDALSRVVQRTPVLTGCARGNWRVSFNGIDRKFDSGKTDKSGAAVINEGKIRIENAALRDVIHLCNSTPYIFALENGYSRQAPAGIVEPVVREMSSR